MVIVSTATLVMYATALIGQSVNAQTMTTNITSSYGNSTGTDDGSGSISGYGRAQRAHHIVVDVETQPLISLI